MIGSGWTPKTTGSRSKLAVGIIGEGGTNGFLLGPASVFPTRQLVEKKGEEESREEFLSRVRSAYRAEYKRVRHAVKVSEKEEVRMSVALRDSLLSCVMSDASRCAHILVNGEDELDMKEKKGGKNGSGKGRENMERTKAIPKKTPNPKKGKEKPLGPPPLPPPTPQPIPLSPLANGKKGKSKVQ